MALSHAARSWFATSRFSFKIRFSSFSFSIYFSFSLMSFCAVLSSCLISLNFESNSLIFLLNSSVESRASFSCCLISSFSLVIASSKASFKTTSFLAASSSFSISPAELISLRSLVFSLVSDSTLSLKVLSILCLSISISLKARFCWLTLSSTCSMCFKIFAFSARELCCSSESCWAERALSHLSCSIS